MTALNRFVVGEQAPDLSLITAPRSASDPALVKRTSRYGVRPILYALRALLRRHLGRTHQQAIGLVGKSRRQVGNILMRSASIAKDQSVKVLEQEVDLRKLGCGAQVVIHLGILTAAVGESIA